MCQLPEQGQKWGFLIWLLFSYCALVCIACMSLGKVGSIMFTMQIPIPIGVCYDLCLESLIICSLANSCYHVQLLHFL